MLVPDAVTPLVTLDAIRAPIAADMAAVDRAIRERLASRVALIDQISAYIVGSGGKRLRPALVLLAAGVFGRVDARTHTLAAIIEFIHTATLLHDDVVDDSKLRRGRLTANAHYGNPAAVLVGDFLYSRAFQMLVEIADVRIMRVMADATNTIAEGEVLQLANVHDVKTDEAHYLQVIQYKTAKLFEAACESAAILAGASPADQAALREYGMRLGMAFQLIDDVLDYSGDAATIGKAVGDDLAEGKPTLPLIYTLRHGRAEDAALVRAAIEGGGREQLGTVIGAVTRSGALDYAKRIARREADAARAAIARLPASAHHDSLINLSIFSVERDY